LAAVAVAAGLGLLVCGPSAAEPLGYARREAAGISLHVIEVDLSDPRVVVAPALAAGGLGRAQTFGSFIRRLNPHAALNGTFFSKRSLRPIGDIVAGGKALCFGGMGTAIAFARDGVDIVRLPKGRRVDWSEHRAALAAGPLLVWDGFAKPRPGGEGFGDSHVFSRAAPRSAVGITRENRLLLVTTVRGTSLARLAKAMRELGAVYAINLDGGASAAMYYRGRTIRSPGRVLTNLLGVYLKPHPVRHGELRPPQGLDWRAGHRPRPVLRLATKGLRIAAQLPRRWEGKAPVYLKASQPLPDGWMVRVRIDQTTAAMTGALPREVVLDLTALSPTADHEISLGLVDAQGKTVRHVERIFRLGELARA